MPSSSRLQATRARLGLSQQQMAALLGVSFASVNRWEGGHSSPMGTTRDLYLALEAALRRGHSAEAICRAARNERGRFLYTVFHKAYGQPGRKAR